MEQVPLVTTWLTTGAGKSETPGLVVDGQRRSSSLITLLRSQHPMKDPSPQRLSLSPEPFAPRRMRARVRSSDPATSRALGRQTREQKRTDQELITEGHGTAFVRVRKGQSAFRKRLLEVFGEVCAFSGPSPAPALEAAHLDSYAASGKHHEDGGLLLRSDLHRLFDQGLIAVNPNTKTLHLDDSLHAYPDYAKLDGAPLTVSVTAGHIEWLTKHWNMHRAQ